MDNVNISKNIKEIDLWNPYTIGWLRKKSKKEDQATGPALCIIFYLFDAN